MNYQKDEKDEFGRDNILHNPIYKSHVIANDYITQLKKVFENMTWAEFCYAKEEEEEREEYANKMRQYFEEQAAKTIQKQNDILLAQQRKNLLEKGDYILEEGEVLE